MRVQEDRSKGHYGIVSGSGCFTFHATSPMKEHKGQNALNGRLFLGFGFVLIGIDADRLNLSFRWTEVAVLRFSNQSSMRDLDACGFGHRMAFGSRFPILPEERSPVLPGSLDDHQATGISPTRLPWGFRRAARKRAGRAGSGRRSSKAYAQWPRAPCLLL